MFATTPNRPTKLTPFITEFEKQTEKELSSIFRRPPRTYQEDFPFYPYLPFTPQVNFTLNYKF